MCETPEQRIAFESILKYHEEQLARYRECAAYGKVDEELKLISLVHQIRRECFLGPIKDISVAEALAGEEHLHKLINNDWRIQDE